jgi:hypothetical protein
LEWYYQIHVHPDLIRVKRHREPKILHSHNALWEYGCKEDSGMEEPVETEPILGPAQEEPTNEVESSSRVFPHRLNALLDQADDPPKKSKGPRMKPDPAGPWGWMR